MRVKELKKLKARFESRQRIANRLDKGLTSLRGLNVPSVMPDYTHVYYFFPLILDIPMLGLAVEFC
jgi:perosamine synthetase